MITAILILVPLVVAFGLLFSPDSRKSKELALYGSLVTFVLSLIAVYIYETHCHCNLQAAVTWLEDFGVTLAFAVDGLSLLMILLTTLLTPLIILSAWNHPYRNPSVFFGLILLMESAFIGVFTAFDGLVFYIFWEMALIPAYFLCAVWGGNDRIRITFKFFLYTFIGSLLMLAALIYLYLHTPGAHSFHLYALYSAEIPEKARPFIFFAFMIAFGIKIPIFPLHTWQPDTYTTAPPAGTMLLSGIMLKMGLYGIIRFVLPLTPRVAVAFGPYIVTAAIAGIIYASIIALRQNDMKRLIAYSSIAHVGLIAAGLFVVNAQAFQGAMIQMVSHGITVTGLFILAAMIEQRTGTREISSLGGIARSAPIFAAFFLIILLGSIALPLTSGFVGEFLILLGMFQFNPWVAAVAGLTIIFGAIYMLRVYHRVALGETVPGTSGFKDMDLREILFLSPLVIAILWIGIYPAWFLKTLAPVVTDLMSILH